MQNSENLFVILDGYSYLCQQFLGNLEMKVNSRKKDSMSTGLIFQAMLSLKDFPSKSFSKLSKNIYKVCVFDFKGPSSRDKWTHNLTKKHNLLFNNTKLQYPAIEELLTILGWKLVISPNLRSIDVIGTLAKTASSHLDTNVLIMSGNQDLFQLSSSRVAVYSRLNGQFHDEDRVLKNFGIPASMMLDYDVLNSIGSDRKKIISKITPTLCVKLLKQYGSLANIITGSTSSQDPTVQLISDVRDILFRIRDTLLIDVECDFTSIHPSLPSLDTFRSNDVDKSALREFYIKYGFKRDLEYFDRVEKKLAKQINGIKSPVRPTSEKVLSFLKKLIQTQPRLNNCNYESNTDYCVYRIRNIESNRVYYGSSNNPLRRWKEHLRGMDFGDHYNEKIRSDLIKYGLDSFEFRILKIFSSSEAMKIYEQLLIIMYWGRQTCCNREILVDNSKRNELVIITATHKSFIDKKANRGAAAKIKGYGNYLSVHAASKDLDLRKSEVQAALNMPGISVNGWSFRTV